MVSTFTSTVRLVTVMIAFLGLVACQTPDNRPSPVKNIPQPSVSPTQPAALVEPEIVEESATATPPPEPSPIAPATAAPAAITTSPDPTIPPPPSVTPEPPASPVDNILLEPVVNEGLTQPLYLTHAGDDRLFIVEQAGLIRIIKDGTLLPDPFLDLRDRVVYFANEQGLLGMVFHNDVDEGKPDHFYVNYTGPAGETFVSRFAINPANPDLAVASSETVLLQIPQPFPNHNGGNLKFGPDGYLYIGLGDGGSADDPLENGQNVGTLLGSMLRIDVSAENDTYTIPADNPFIDHAGARAEIWAWGLRNPWRYSFDRLTGDLFIGDVGQGALEEVDLLLADSNSASNNYGWAIFEGTTCLDSNRCETSDLVEPIFEYGHDQGCSITGGYMYRGRAFPELWGNYFVGDFCTGVIWRLFPNNMSNWDSAVVLDSDLLISSFGEDADGELYVVDRASGGIFQIQPAD